PAFPSFSDALVRHSPHRRLLLAVLSSTSTASSPSTAARPLTRRPKLPCPSLAISSKRSVTVGSVCSSTIQIRPRVSFTSPSNCRWINLPPPR
ncbi:hypothetical protein PIB30_099909, partial [Stylosanthes scabra]|nr:hypothetical protein [Stylosanthes scabra]